MADNVLSLAVAVLDTLASYPAGKIKSAWLAKKDLGKLQRYLDTICPFIEDAEKTPSDSNLIKKWVRDLKDVCYDIDDLLDEAAAETLELEAVKGECSDKRDKVRNYISYAKKKIISKTISPFILSTKIRNILDRLEEIHSRTNKLSLVAANLAQTVPVAQSSHHRITYPLPFVNKSSNIKGRDKAKREILDRVLRNDVECSFGLSVLPIVGIGGLGKTTLAQLVYWDPAVREKFDMHLWACVSDPFKTELVLERLLIGNSSEPAKSVLARLLNGNSLDLAKLVDMLGSEVRDKKYFMVLDDIWTRNANEWNHLKDILLSAGGGAEGSVILVTTRDEQVATRTIGVKKPYYLEELPFILCKSVFVENAFGTQEEYERYPYLAKYVEAIVKRCGGVPLAAKTLGSSLRGERDGRKWRRVAKSDLWEIEEKNGGILAALKLSYSALDSRLKSCFAYLSIFPKDHTLYADGVVGSIFPKDHTLYADGVVGSIFPKYHTLYADDVVAKWIAQGLVKRDNTLNDELEDTGYKYFEELYSRSLLHEPAILASKGVCGCEMHDLVHDLAMEVMREELGLVSWDNPNVSRSVRHIAWCEDDDLSNKEELPRQLIVKVNKVRTLIMSGNTVNKKLVEQIILTFRCLRVLDLSFCDIEEISDSIGNLKHLRYLSLKGNRSIKALSISISKLLNLQVLHLSGCSGLEELPSYMGKFKNLRYLQVTVQSRYLFPKGMTGFVNPPSLRILEIRDCNEMISLLPEEDEDEDAVGKIKFLTQLHALRVVRCPKLSSLLSNSLVYLTALKELVIFECESLDWRVELPSEPGLGGMEPNGLQSLELLEVWGVPKLVGLPNGLEVAAPSLRGLYIADCEGLTSLPDWMKSCNLLGLELWDCPNLSSLPQEVLASLQRLRIICCKKLPLSGIDISHIPDCGIEEDDSSTEMESDMESESEE